MKSISPIIATILIVVITVAIAGIFYAFTSGIFGSLTQSSSQQIQQQSQITSFTISNVYCSNNILYFNIYNNGNIPININNSQIIFTDNNGNTISINGSNIICNNGNIIPSGSNSLCYIINSFCYYSYTDYIKTTNFVYNGISYSYSISNSNNFNLIYLPNSSSYQVTLYNSQSIPTPAPFQQDIAICNGSINIGNNFAYVNNVTLFNQIDSNGQNVLFFNPNNNQLFYYSWYEGQLNYNGVTCDVWWVNLPNGISANSNITIYMNIGPSIDNYYQQYYPYVGEAPQLSSTYGQYDNGNYVFLFYDNFAGTTLNTNKWNYGYNSGGSIIIHNGLTINYTSSSSGGAWIISKYNFPQSQGVVWYALMNFYGTSNFNDVRIRIYFWSNSYQVAGNANNGNWRVVLDDADYGYFTTQNVGSSTTQLYWAGYGLTPALPSSTSQNDYNILMIQILNSTGLVWNTYTITNNNISLFQSFSQNGTVSGNFSILFESSQDGAGYANIVLNVEYTFLAAAPPNGVMPSIYIS
jgi:flagellin-like protein